MHKQINTRTCTPHILFPCLYIPSATRCTGTKTLSCNMPGARPRTQCTHVRTRTHAQANKYTHMHTTYFVSVFVYPLGNQVHGDKDFVVQYAWGQATHNKLKEMMSKRPIFDTIDVRCLCIQMCGAWRVSTRFRCGACARARVCVRHTCIRTHTHTHTHANPPSLSLIHI